MNDFFDNVSRILATPMPRRKAMKLFGGALAAAVVAVAGVQPIEAAGCTKNDPKTSTTCGTGGGAKCCAQGTCCAKNGTVTNCCAKGQYVCPDGTCSASNGGANKTCKKC
jgi:hypothetical protein